MRFRIFKGAQDHGIGSAGSDTSIGVTWDQRTTYIHVNAQRGLAVPEYSPLQRAGDIASEEGGVIGPPYVCR